MDVRSKRREAGLPVHPERMAALVSAVTGAIMGAGLGIFAAAGVSGMLAGALLGAAGGAGVAAYVRLRSTRSGREEAESV